MFKKLLLGIALSLFAASSFAAVTGNNPVSVQVPKAAFVQFLQGTDVAGTYKTLYTGGSNASKITGIYATTNDASASHLVTCQYKSSAVYYGGVATTVAINSGFANAAPAINLMASNLWPGLPVDGSGDPYIYVNSGDTIACTFATALTSTDVLNVVAVVSDF